MSNYPDNMDHSRLSGDWELRVEKRVEELRDLYSKARAVAKIIAVCKEHVIRIMEHPAFTTPTAINADYICSFLSDAQSELGVSDKQLQELAIEQLNEED